MKVFILSIIATISLVSLVIYDFLCICRIIKKEEVVEKIWKQIIKNKEYEEKLVFIFIRPIFLQISFITYILSIGVLDKMGVFRFLIVSAPILAILTVIANNRKN